MESGTGTELKEGEGNNTEHYKTSDDMIKRLRDDYTLLKNERPDDFKAYGNDILESIRKLENEDSFDENESGIVGVMYDGGEYELIKVTNDD